MPLERTPDETPDESQEPNSEPNAGKATSSQRLLDRLNQSEPSPEGEEPPGEDLSVDGETVLGNTNSEPNASGDPPTEPTDPPSDPWLEEVRELGFQDIESPEEARARLVEAYRQAQERENLFRSRFEQITPLVRYGQQYIELQKDEEFKSFIEKRQKPEEQKGEPWWNPPQYDPALVERYRVSKIDPATGEEVETWADRTPASVRSQVEAYEDYIRNWQHNLVYHPDKAIGEAVRQEFKRLYEEERSREIQEETKTGVLDRFRRENADLIYEKDPVSNRLTDRLSAHGKAIQYFMDEAEDSGATSPEFILNYALMRYRQEFGGEPSSNGHPNGSPAQTAPQQTNQQTVQQTVQQKQQDHLRRGVNSKRSAQPNRAGSVSRPDEPAPRNKNLTSGHRLLEQLQVDGVI